MSESLSGRRARSRVLRVSLASILAAAFVAAGSGAAGANTVEAAEPPEERALKMQAFTPEQFAEQAAALPQDLVAAVRRDLDMSAREYLAHAASARRGADVVEALQPAVRSAWLVGDTLHVAVDDRAAAGAVRAAGAEAHVGDGLTDALAAARAQDKLAYVDREAGRVMPVDAALRGEPVGRSGLVAQSSWRGGDGFAMSDLLMDYRCSTGFAGTTADGSPRVLTAGHCGSTDDGLLSSPVSELDLHETITTSPVLEDEWPEHIGESVGEFVADTFTFGEGHDAGLIDVTAEGWDVLPEVTSPKATADSGGVQVLDSTDPIAGAVACSSGVTSGWTCGRVLATETTAKVSGRAVTGFLFDACVLPGDSGGAVMTGPYALGINSGSTWRSTDCSAGTVSEASAGTDVSLGYTVSGGADTAEGLYGDEWDLLVHVGTPTVTSPGDEATVGSTPTVSGTVDAAAGATVEVSIDGGPTLEATVGPAGRWTVPVAESLDPGAHSFEASASHTPATSGTATSGGAATGTFDVATVASLNPTWPRAGDTTTAKRPTFTGTGQPDATVELKVGDEVRASTTVPKDGSWSITPDDGLAAGRFDVVLTQQTGEGSSSVTVPDVGLQPGTPVITSPRPGEAVAGHTISGVGAAGATISVRLQPGGEQVAGDDGEALRVRAGDDGAWEIELTDPLPDGSQTVVATQSVDGLASEPSTAVSFAVDQRAGSAHSGGKTLGVAARDDDLTGTGAATSTTPLLWGAAALLAAGAIIAVTAWRRRMATR